MECKSIINYAGGNSAADILLQSLNRFPGKQVAFKKKSSILFFGRVNYLFIGGLIYRTFCLAMKQVERPLHRTTEVNVWKIILICYSAKMEAFIQGGPQIWTSGLPAIIQEKGQNIPGQDFL